MKITTTKTNQTDTLKLSGSVLTINGINYDLDNAAVLPVLDEETGVTESPNNQRVYLQGADTVIYLNIDDEHQFDFINKNFALFFDVDLNGDISLSELADYITHYNLTEADRRKNRKAIMDKFTPEEWKARIAALKTV